MAHQFDVARQLRIATLCIVLAPAVAGAQQRTERSALESSDWFSGATEEIRASEYRFDQVRGEPDVWSAPNRKQELRSRVERRGIEVFPRAVSADGVGAEWRLMLGTRSFGREGFQRELASGIASFDGARAELQRGALREWFENGDEGIAHGWTIERRPPGVEPVVVGLAIAGLSLRIDDGGRSGVFVGADGELRLRSTRLVARDATGVALTARLHATQTGVAVRVEDDGAVYPVTVEALLTNAVWTFQSNQANAWFGLSVSTAGDVNGDGYSDVIVGANLYDNGETDEGRAYVFHGSPLGLSSSAAWIGESNQAGARYGFSSSTAGDVNGDGYSDVIVGAFDYDNGESNEGGAWVYYGSATGLAAGAAWSAEADQVDARFGYSVSSAGDVNGDGYSDVVVGAHQYDNGHSDEGRAYVYLGSAAGLAASATWTAEADQTDAFYGHVVAAAGDVNGDGYDDVLAGAYLYDNGQADEGRAYVYHGSAAGLASSAAWTTESNQAGSWLGTRAGTAGDVNGDGYADVIVSAFRYDNGHSDEGVTWVYHGSASGLSSTPAWTDESNQTTAYFGLAVSTAGDVNGDGYSDILVGAYGYDNGEVDEGRAYLYHGSASGLSSTPAWIEESNQAGARFGYSAATAGDVNGDGYADIIVSAYLYDGGETNEGRAWVYHGAPDGLSSDEDWSAGSSQGGLGVAVSTAGDVNGDGYSDVIVGANKYDGGETDEGRAFVFHGSASGLALGPAWTAEGNQSGAFFGQSVATAGDVNGDGYSDVIVGGYLYDNGETDEGRAWVYHGSASGLSSTPAWTDESNQPSAFFGLTVSTAGDVNGDGYSDVVVGAFLYDNGHSDEGRAYVYHGSATGLGPDAVWIAEPNEVDAYFGFSVATAGDVNGDGYSDVIIGATGAGQPGEGRAWVYHGSPNGVAPTPDWTADGDLSFRGFGHSVATAGDVNGDGYSDVIVGNPAYGAWPFTGGAAFVYHGSSDGLSPAAAWTDGSNQINARFGESVSTAGDVDGDGFSDVVVGASAFDGGETDEGRAYVYRGSSAGLTSAPAWTAESNQVWASFGISVSTAGDVNGDGYSDVIVGAVSYAPGGRAFAYHGNSGDGGLLRAIQQRRTTGIRPIAVRGATTSSGAFRIRAEVAVGTAGVAWAAPGATLGFLEWEVKKLGVPFNGQNLGRSATGQTLPAAGGTVVFDELVTPPATGGGKGKKLLSVGKSFHWRARLVTTNPLLPRSAWFSAPGNAITETKLRQPVK